MGLCTDWADHMWPDVIHTFLLTILNLKLLAMSTFSSMYGIFRKNHVVYLLFPLFQNT